MEIIRLERQTVRFFDGLEVDGYRTPKGEFRVGLSGASLVLGYAENWLYRTLTKQEGRTFKALQGLGFDAYIIKGEIQRPQGGKTTVETISLENFNALIAYAANKGKKAAIALQKSLTQVALNDFFVDAFGEPPLTINEKRELFYKTYAATISPEGWRKMDREEILKLALPGDEPHLKWGLWNQ